MKIPFTRRKQANNETSFQTWLVALHRRGQQIYGKNYDPSLVAISVLYKLYSYCSSNQALAYSLGICQTKGLLLTGATGTGKTSLLQLLKTTVSVQQHYSIRSTKELLALETRSMRAYPNPFTVPIYALDDLNIDLLKGNNSALIIHILRTRQANCLLTHACSNTTFRELKNWLGTTIVLEEIFNVIVVDDEVIKGNNDDGYKVTSD